MSIVSIIKVFIFLLHTSLIAYLVFKLRDIKLRPRLYNTPKNYDRYKKSIWYWPEKADCPKNSPPDKAGQTVCYYFIVLGILLFVPSILYEQADIFKGKYIDCFYSDWWIASFILSFIFILSAGFCLPIFSSRPECICYSTFHLFPRRPWWIKWKYCVTILLLSCCITFPIRAVALCSYGHADENRLVYSPSWTLAEHIFEYDNISRTEIIPGESESDSGHYYIYNHKGQRFDLYNGTSISDEALEYIIARIENPK